MSAIGEGSIANALKDLESANLKSQIIISVFAKTKGEYKVNENNAKIIEAVNVLKKCEQELDYKLKFILATEYNDLGIYENKADHHKY